MTFPVPSPAPPLRPPRGDPNPLAASGGFPTARPRPEPVPWPDRLLTLWYRRRWRGLHGLWRLLRGSPTQGTIIVGTAYGSRFALHPFDCIDGCVIDEGFYESEVLEAVRPDLTPGAVLWVVGANFGLHAVTAKFLCPEALVVAFEPAPAMAARVYTNCALNRVTVDVHAYALFDRSTQLPLFANVAGNPGMSTMFPLDELGYDQRLVVATRTAAEVVADRLAPLPTAMIVDVEGAEVAVLRGLGGHLADPRLHVLVFEASNDFLVAGQPAELRELLLGAGFQIRKLQRREHTAHALSNFVAVRS